MEKPYCDNVAVAVADFPPNEPLSGVIRAAPSGREARACPAAGTTREHSLCLVRSAVIGRYTRSPCSAAFGGAMPGAGAPADIDMFPACSRASSSWFSWLAVPLLGCVPFPR